MSSPAVRTPDSATPSAPHVERVCARTGLLLRPAAQQTIRRVAKTSYGALNPQQRDGIGDRSDWGRYDVAGGRTAYGASPREAAFGESLAAQRLKFTRIAPTWQDLFDDAPPPGVTSLLQAVELEWADRQYMPPGTVAAGWRHERLVYELRLPASGWFIDIERSESIAVVSQGLKSELAALGLQTLTTGDLRGERRDVTTTIAGWLRGQVLDDGSLPHGIRFGSKHDSTWTCWAIWLRALDDGKPLSSEPTTSDSGVEIKGWEQNEELARVVRLFGLKCF